MPRIVSPNDNELLVLFQDGHVTLLAGGYGTAAYSRSVNGSQGYPADDPRYAGGTGAGFVPNGGPYNPQYYVGSQDGVSSLFVLFVV